MQRRCLWIARHGFKLQKLERPLVVRNVDGTNNSEGAITHQVECNVFYKGHIERMRIDVCDLGKTEMILGMPWLAAHNPEINWETGEVKMTRCPPLCCHDLAKWLSHYLYFFSFLFLFLWTYNYEVEHGKVSRDFVTMSQWCDGWSQIVMSQGVT